MTLDTSGTDAATTQNDNAKQDRVLKPVGSYCKYTLVTGSHDVVIGIVAEPAEESGETGGYVFRVTPGKSVGPVTIMLNTKRLAERQRVRKVNRAIQRARRR